MNSTEQAGPCGSPLTEGLAGPHENRHNLGAQHACNE